MRKKRFVALLTEPVTHEARNTGPAEQRVIRVELR